MSDVDFVGCWVLDAETDENGEQSFNVYDADGFWRGTFARFADAHLFILAAIRGQAS